MSQPDPKLNDHPPVWNAIIDMFKDSDDEINKLLVLDMRKRHRKGMETYGVPLQPFNGRDALVDAYEEVLDLCVYLKQVEIETGKHNSAELIGALAIAQLLRYKLYQRKNSEWSG
jgi:hypothetical protein